MAPGPFFLIIITPGPYFLSTALSANIIPENLSLVSSNKPTKLVVSFGVVSRYISLVFPVHEIDRLTLYLLNHRTVLGTLILVEKKIKDTLLIGES